MKVSERRLFSQPRERVWEKLMDFGVLARTLPGVETLEPTGEDTCRLALNVLVPSITGTYEGTVRVVEKDPVDSYRLRGEAKGRLGWIRGDAEFDLTDESGGTQVLSTMDFQSGGMLSGVGQRFMEGVAKSMLRDFLKSFANELEGDGAMPNEKGGAQ